MIQFWTLVAKEDLKNLNEVSWNDSGTEVIRPNTEGQEVNLYDQTSEHQFQNELPRSVAVEFFSDDIWVIHKKESYSNPIQKFL